MSGWLGLCLTQAFITECVLVSVITDEYLTVTQTSCTAPCCTLRYVHNYDLTFCIVRVV
jgi:hypothetical protein